MDMLRKRVYSSFLLSFKIANSQAMSCYQNLLWEHMTLYLEFILEDNKQISVLQSDAMKLSKQ